MSWKYLQYDGETGKKRTVNGGSGGASVLNDLDDVNVSSPSDGQILRYDSQNGEWVNSNQSGITQQDVSNLLSVHSGITVANFTIKAYKTGNIVTLFCRGNIPNGYAPSGTLYELLDIDSSITPVLVADNWAFGGNSYIGRCRADTDSMIKFNGGNWCSFQISWCVA